MKTARCQAGCFHSSVVSAVSTRALPHLHQILRHHDASAVVLPDIGGPHFVGDAVVVARHEWLRTNVFTLAAAAMRPTSSVSV